MAPTGNYSGQFWNLTPWRDGSYKLTNWFTGEEKSLDTYSGSHEPFLNTGDHSGQHWILTKVRPVTEPVSIPALDPGGYVNKTEGPTDWSLYIQPHGTVRAVMVFVDFSDAPAGNSSARDVASHLLGDGKAEQLFSDDSFEQLDLKVDICWQPGWKRMPESSTDYDLQQFQSQRSYIADAADLFSEDEADFSRYQMVFIVPTEAADFPLSPAFTAREGDGAPAQSDEIRWAVTFGSDSYSNRYINLVHEVGHLFGLPDLYPVTGNDTSPTGCLSLILSLFAGFTLIPPSPANAATNSQAGCWGIMSDIFHAVHFLGWHLHKNQWLAADREFYLSHPTAGWYITLTPFHWEAGVSLLALPMDGPENPSRVCVIEIVRPVLGTNQKYHGKGVLISIVDATVPSGGSPLKLIPRITSNSQTYGYLYEAPYQVGDTMNYSEDGISISVEVLQQFDEAFNIKIAYQRRD